MEYKDFIEHKKFLTPGKGFDPLFMPDYLFDFQKYLVTWNLANSRTATFAGCGLGKTIQSLVFAQNLIMKTNKPVLILTPLSVGLQFKEEADRFGIEAVRSRDGKFKPSDKIIITNYEQLSKFNSNDFSTLICDECFAPDTIIQVYRDSKLHNIKIKDCVIGDNVINCTGVDTIKHIKKKKVDYAIKLGFNGKIQICSPKHPFFTQRGWVSAKELQKGDAIITTDKAMQILRRDFRDSLEIGTKESILRDILLSEMAYEPARAFSEGSHKRSSHQSREKNVRMVQNRKRSVKGGFHTQSEAHVQLRNTCESISNIESNEPPTFSAWGQWSRDDITTAIDAGCAVGALDSGICYITGKETNRLPDVLQSGFSKLRAKSCDRGRWELTLFEKESRREEGRKTGYFGVESFEVLEQGCAELDRYRDESGTLYFYDLEIEQHPSFTINECLVHNSSCMKNFDGMHKAEITEFMKRVPYRLLCSATPSPNDYIELGTSSEALGYLGYMDMLTKFFKNDTDSIKLAHMGQKWRFKEHAKTDFWRWLSSWSRAVSKPSDLGFENGDFELPPLIENTTVLPSPSKTGEFFSSICVTMDDIREDNNTTLESRCLKSAELLKDVDVGIAWCNLNKEADLLTKYIKGAVNVSGSDSDDEKEEKFEAFKKGKIRVLVSKPKIAAFGMNFQFCSNMTYFPNYSYESYHQAVRRCYRFGQTKEVNVHLISTEAQTRVVESMLAKAQACDIMFSNIVKYMSESYHLDGYKNDVDNMEIPTWL